MITWRPAGDLDNGAIQRRDVSIFDIYCIMMHDAPVQIQALAHSVLKVGGFFRTIILRDVIASVSVAQFV
jgi:hypothetical protein